MKLILLSLIFFAVAINCNVIRTWGPIPTAKGMTSIGGRGKFRVYERNGAAKMDEDDPLNNLVGVTKDGLFKQIGRGIKQIKTQVLDSCGKALFPHLFFNDWITGMPKMYCEHHRCLDPVHIECQKHVKLQNCATNFQWVAGFMKPAMEGGGDEIEVECCFYKQSLETKFIQNANISERDYWDHSLIIEKEKLTGMEYFNNIRKIENGNHGLLYSVSVYQMKCPTFEISENPH